MSIERLDDERIEWLVPTIREIVPSWLPATLAREKARHCRAEDGMRGRNVPFETTKAPFRRRAPRHDSMNQPPGGVAGVGGVGSVPGKPPPSRPPPPQLVG